MRSSLRIELSIHHGSVSGSAYLLGHNVSSFDLLARRFRRTSAPALLGRRLLRSMRPELARLLRPGDILVAGRNFGYRTYREHAVMAILGAGVRCVIAESFSRSFERRASELGLILIVSPEAVAGISDRNEVSVDFASGEIINHSFAARFQADPRGGNLRSNLLAHPAGPQGDHPADQRRQSEGAA